MKTIITPQNPLVIEVKAFSAITITPNDIISYSILEIRGGTHGDTIEKGKIRKIWIKGKASITISCNIETELQYELI